MATMMSSGPRPGQNGLCVPFSTCRRIAASLDFSVVVRELRPQKPHVQPKEYSRCRSS